MIKRKHPEKGSEFTGDSPRTVATAIARPATGLDGQPATISDTVLCAGRRG
jgi:hypothetical protein